MYSMYILKTVYTYRKQNVKKEKKKKEEVIDCYGITVRSSL